MYKRGIVFIILGLVFCKILAELFKTRKEVNVCDLDEDFEMIDLDIWNED